MLALHLVAKTYQRRPSEIIGIADEWAAYQFDVAVLVEGTVGEQTDTHAGTHAPPVSFDWSGIAT
jgi:hypothetical protein